MVAWMTDDDFGIQAPAASRPFAFPEDQVRGGWAITFKSLLASWDDFVARSLREEAVDLQIDRTNATAAQLAERRAHRLARLVERVATLTRAGEDRTADAPAFLARLAELRPDVFDVLVAYCYSADAYRPEDAPAPAPLDPEPIAGNS